MFRAAVRSEALGSFWCGAIQSMVLSAAGAREVNVDSSQLIASNDPAHLYRLILTTGTAYYNNHMEVSVYLVDFYRRKDYGDPSTSLLLKALLLVSRYRFMFLEDQSEFHYINIALADIAQIPELARRIISELDLLTSDMYVADLQLPATWGKFVSLETVQEMHSIWSPLDERLRHCCDPRNFETPEKSSNTGDSISREKLLATRNELANVLEECRKQISPYNTKLLQAMAAKLVEVTALTAAKSGAPST
jgi:hypothetical protein